jgi:hypothetical protein
MTVDELHGKMTEEFKAVRAELRAAITGEETNTRNYIDAAIKTEHTSTRNYIDAAIKSEQSDTRNYIDAAITTAVRAEGERTRRHFDVVAEQFKEYTKVLAEGTARNPERLDDHEKRIRALEGGSS